MNARTRETWALRLEERAREHWTSDRLAALTDGKRLAVLPHEAPALLRALGLLDADAAMPPQRVSKYLQINHLVRLVEPTFATLPELAILDAGCGRSYLTLVLAWCARQAGKRVSILGIDRNPDVIDECRRRTALAELDDVVRFEVADLATIDPADTNAVVALHACDTATCDAIALGVRARAQVIAVAPCCQAELARGWAALENTTGGFAPIWNAPHLRREIAADVTDVMRMCLLRAAGYEVTAAELVGHEHTKKNTLLRAVRGAADARARTEYEALVATTGGCGLGLADRLLR